LSREGRRLPTRASRLASRALDVAAVLLVGFVVWRFLIAPRALAPASALAPKISLASLGGGTYRLGEPNGRVVFLDFWASWCEPCRLSMPLVEAFARAHPDVDVLAVDEGEPRDVAARYAREHGVERVILDAGGRAAASLGVSAYPTVVTIDRAGFVRAKWAGFNPAIGVAMQHARDSLDPPPVVSVPSQRCRDSRLAPFRPGGVARRSNGAVIPRSSRLAGSKNRCGFVSRPL
jgi:thiol-disulfide isomerase/thioredoxin